MSERNWDALAKKIEPDPALPLVVAMAGPSLE
jgi:hypothetical protein